VRRSDWNRASFRPFANHDLGIRRKMMRFLLFPAMAAGALALGGCASNYAGEGALAGGAAGALLGAATGDVGTGAAIGAAAGAVGGTLIKKHGHDCYYRDRNGRRYRERC
jgi:hypothetical protein